MGEILAEKTVKGIYCKNMEHPVAGASQSAFYLLALAGF